MTQQAAWREKASGLTAFPKGYKHYVSDLLAELHTLHTVASKARSLGLDPSLSVDSELAFDLPERVEKLLGVSVADRLRELLERFRTEQAALFIAEEVALGKYGFLTSEQALDLGVRMGLAVVTEGVTVAPLQGISAVKVKKNEDGSSYASVSFAGPIRSAGGTEAAFTIVIADRIRSVLGLDRCRPNAWGDDEVGRFVEELRIYERDVGNFQYKVSDEDVRRTILHLPVEVDGVETDPVEVVVHRGLKRILTDRVRGGALRVLNDGVIGRSRKLLKLLEDLAVPGWEWLAELKGGRQQSYDENAPAGSHFEEVISGRPVLAFPKRPGGFRLRYGRSYNTGLSTVGVHPATATLLDDSIVTGTQVKLDLPGKAATVAFTNAVEPPIARLKGGSVVKVESLEFAAQLDGRVEKILHLGDILVSYGDFLENNIRLPPSGYVEEWWVQDLQHAIRAQYAFPQVCAEELGLAVDRLEAFFTDPVGSFPSAAEAFLMSERLGVPLHPRHLFYWDLASPGEVFLLRQKLSVVSEGYEECAVSAPNEGEVKGVLEKLGVPHEVEDHQLTLTGEAAYAVMRTLGLPFEAKPPASWRDICEMLSVLSRVPIRRKSSVYVGVRVGRPEKAMLRRMKPPVHVLFPVGEAGGPARDILQAAERGSVHVELANMVCRECGSNVTTPKCRACGGLVTLTKTCPVCGRMVEREACPRCEVAPLPYTKRPFPIKDALSAAVSRVKHQPRGPLKGVRGLTNQARVPDALEKGLLRQKHELYIYKDGTIRFDATNAPLTHFKPRDIGTPIDDLRRLGYRQDAHGESLHSDTQLVELLAQDIILPVEAGECLVKAACFVDTLLTTVYGEEPVYRVRSKQDLVGHLVVGLAPHTSVGVVGRVIGFTPLQVCFAHPYWHSAKRRDCDGDEDAVMLLMDVLLNFSKAFLPAQIGGLMDAPLLLQPVIVPYEVQRQAHNFDVAERYPTEFYEATLRSPLPTELTDLVPVVRSRLKRKEQFHGFRFTHPTPSICMGASRSVYSRLKSLPEKLEKQLELAERVGAVDAVEVAASVLKTHLLPDITGNLKAYASQLFRCKACGRHYRRIPLKAECLACGGELQATVPRGAVEKYLSLALELCNRFNVDPYLKARLELASEELVYLFAEKKGGAQRSLTEFLR